MTHFMAAFAVAFTFALQSANAQDDVGRWYVGGSIGKSKFSGIALDDFCDSVFEATKCSDKDTSVKFYGGYTPHKNFSVEGGFIEFGQAKIIYGSGQFTVTVESGVKSFFLAGMGKIRVHPEAILFGKFGLHQWQWDLGLDQGDVDLDLEDDGVDLFYGIGGEVAPFSNKKIKLRMEYEMFELENFYDTHDLVELIDDIDTDLEFLSIGVTYTF